MFSRRVVGLDIGSYAVKAAELEAGLRGVEFVRLEQFRIPRDSSPQELEATIELFLDQHDFSRELLACAIPTARVTQRHLRFPFSGAKRIAEAIPFELEEQLPFPISGAVITHEQVLAQPDQTDVLVVMSRHAEVAAFLETMRGMQIEPRILEVEGAVLANVCTYLKLADMVRLVADVGHSKTNLCLLVDGKPVLLRSIGTAGHHLTEAIAKDLAVSYDVAEERKHEQGIFEPGTTTPICPSVGAVLEQLTREMLRSIQSVVGNPMDAIAPGEIVLMGGSANLNGLAIYFEEEVGIPCSVLTAASAESGAEMLASAGTPSFAQAVSLALRISTSERVTQLDLRQGEFEYAADLSGLRSQLRIALPLFIICLLLWPISLYSAVLARSNQAENLRARLKTVCEQTFPRASCETNTYQVMKDELRTTRELAEHLGVTSSGLSALDVLRELSERIPVSLDVSLSEVKIERHSLLIRGHAKDLESVGRMKRALATFELFESVPDPSTQRDARQGGQSFSLTIKFQEAS
jgi:type IV pilus assembly protein PilM